MTQMNRWLCAAFAANVVGCAQPPQVVPGIDNDAQFCELTMGRLRLYCEYMERRAAGQPDGEGISYVCADGISTSPRVASADDCFSFLWTACEAAPPNSPCGIPVGPWAACQGAHAETCATGVDAFPPGEGWEPGTG